MGKRILVIDDEEVVLGAIRKALARDPYTLTTVLDAAEGLALHAEAPFDIIVTDLMMPEIGGLALLARLRERANRSPVIMITGYPTIRTALLARQNGAFDYVTKPFTHDELRSVVARAVRMGELPVPDRARQRPDAPGQRFYIPDHAWVAVEGEHRVRMGLAPALALAIGAARDIRAPATGRLFEQGRAFLTILSDDRVEHTIHAPLTGVVREVNPLVLARPGLVTEDPLGAGWLLVLDPEDLARELRFLSPEVIWGSAG